LKRGLSYVDSNIFIYPIIYDPTSVPEVARARDLEKWRWGKSMPTHRLSLGTRLHGLFEKFLSFPNLKILPLKRTTVLKTQDLVEEYRLKPRDALHAAIALENKITIIVSYDDDLRRLKESSPRMKCLNSPPVNIVSV